MDPHSALSERRDSEGWILEAGEYSHNEGPGPIPHGKSVTRAHGGDMGMQEISVMTLDLGMVLETAVIFP